MDTEHDGTGTAARVVIATPSRRAVSAEPQTGQRSTHTPGSSYLRGGPPSQRQGLSASGRKVTATTPHARAAARALDSRRAAIFTPINKERRRSLKEQRPTPRNALRALSRALATNTEQVASSSSPQDHKPSSSVGAIPEEGEEEKEEEDDDLPIDRPRLSLPIDVEEDDSDLMPHRSAGLDEDNFTMQSIELPRRATSEQPAGRFSMGSARISDFSHHNNDLRAEDLTIDSAFFPPLAASLEVDESFRAQLDDDIPYERIGAEVGRRDTGRPSDISRLGAPLDGNESTFILAAQVQESPGERVDVGNAVSDLNREDEWADQSGDEEVEEPRLDEENGAGFQIEADESTRSASKPRRRRKKGIKLSKHGVEYPSLPQGVVKKLAQTFAKTSGVKARINPDTLSAIIQASDWFFEQVADDLEAYAKHAGRKTIDESDMLTLLRRQRQTSSSSTPFSLAQRYLPRELLQELRIPPPARFKPARRLRRQDGGDIVN